MNTYQYNCNDFGGLTMDEYNFIQQTTAGLNFNQMQTFTLVYNSRRKNPLDILLGTVLGFLGLAGVQRFMTNQTFIGFLYFFTFGFLGIGTVIDLLSYKSLANEYNKYLAYECYKIAKAHN